MKHPGLMFIFWAALLTVNAFTVPAWTAKAPALVFIPLFAMAISAAGACFCAHQYGA